VIRTRTDGFSLIELMIVVGLIAVLAGMSAPAITAGMRQYSVISASQQVVSTIRAARSQAVGKNVTLRVRFNHPAAGQYQVLDGADAAVGEVQNLPEGADFGAVSGDLEINTSGRVTPLGGAAPTTIVVTNGDDDRTITVSASGRVQLP
jgi:type IV fimbrial biogenesis protein FimT